MIDVMLFLEDLGHESVTKALVERIAREKKVAIDIKSRSARGGHGRALDELRRFMRDLHRGRQVGVPRILVVAIDANCKGLNTRKKEIEECVPEEYRPFLVCAVPDPHIERWLLLDSNAFRVVLGEGCQAPDYKCERDRYKNKLAAAIQQAGLTPLLGGMEHAQDIVDNMDLDGVSARDASFGSFVGEFRRRLQNASST